METTPPSTSTSAGAGAEQDAPASLLPSAEGRDVSKSGSSNEKRKDVLSWDEYFMSVAFLSSKRSKDPRTQVGACIVNKDNRIVGTGYNGMPNGCSDDKMPWGVDNEDILETKRPYVCHAELNAIVNKIQADIRGCRMYVALFPCNQCAKLIIQSGITEVIYFSDKYHREKEFKAAPILFDHAKVKYRQYGEPAKTSININFKDIDQDSS